MNKICRICLEEGVLSSIFDKNYTLSMREMIEYCSRIKISRNDGLPEQICSNCMYKLGIAYHFKQSSENSDMRLRHYLGLPTTVKFLDASVMTDPIETRQTTTIIKKCKCKFKEQKKTISNYKRKPESLKRKRGPKPKPKKTHSCFQCQKEFRCQAQLETHIRTHTGDKPFECMYCQKRFNQKHNLTIHQRVHTGEKPFQCDVCSKTFSAQGNLQTHLKIHTGQKDHVCTICDKSFITSSELTRHMNKHKCNLCDAAYIQNRDLKLHKLSKHQIAMSDQKTQNEAFNNSNNIDIIGVDDGNASLPPKEMGNEFILPHNKVGHSVITESHALLYEQKNDKVFHHYKTENEHHNCSICGQGFTCVASLAQHCHSIHKSYDPIHVPKPYA